MGHRRCPADSPDRAQLHIEHFRWAGEEHLDPADRGGGLSPPADTVHLGLAGKERLGLDDRTPLGLAGKERLGLDDRTPLGLAGKERLGLDDRAPLGLAGKERLGLADRAPLGLAGKERLGLAGRGRWILEQNPLAVGTSFALEPTADNHRLCKGASTVACCCVAVLAKDTGKR
jgi:hypothetical protein